MQTTENEGLSGFIETPLVFARVIDELLGPRSYGETDRSDIGKRRKRCRQMLGLEDYGYAAPSFSLGSRGRVAFELLPVYACVQTARRWGWGFAEILAHAYRTAGLRGLVKAGDLEKSVGHFSDHVQAAFRNEQPPDEDRPSFLASHQVRLLEDDPAFRVTGERLAAINARVADLMPAVSRVPGRVVRYDHAGPDDTPVAALVVEEERGEDVTRLVEDPGLLLASGLIPGDCYVRTRLNWTEDVEARVIVPAFDRADQNREVLVEKLRTQMSPLPRPPAHWRGWTE